MKQSFCTSLMSRAAMLLVTMLCTMTAGSTTVTLTSETGFVTLQNGDILTGTGGVDTKVQIADGATVTLRGVDITAYANDKNHLRPGIECLGNATINLAVGTVSNVKGGYNKPGIFVPKDKTLTISGDGSLNATGGDGGAGIGSGDESSCGNITISGGTVTATGGSLGAGIGSGDESSCGDITISGGTVTATGGSLGAGIGSGGFDNSFCGDITISGGTVTATGCGQGAGIGTGCVSSCGNITIEEGITRITAIPGKNGGEAIGKGDFGTCGTISIVSTINQMTMGNARLLYPGTLQNGAILMGTGDENTRVSIADGATVTLSGVDITQSSSKSWAGITCKGDATIILEEGMTNNVKGGPRFSGIYIPKDKTLTIRGSGSLNATGGGYGAGIGNGRNQTNCGNIVIEGGTITANGGIRGAGIGTGESCRCGYIAIRGGNVTAMGGSMSAGIGGGQNGVCGDITIGEGVTRVIATMGSGASNPIGLGYGGSCGNVTVSPKLVDVTLGSTRTIYFEEPVVPFPENNTKLCTLTSKRGGMVMNANGTGLAAGQSRTNATDEDKRFAIITYDGKQYLYSPKARKYLRNDGTFVSRLGSPVIIDGKFASGDYKYMLFIKDMAGDAMVFNNDGSDIVTNDHNTPDDGNRWCIEPVADFDPREALAIIGLELQDNNSNADIIAEYDNIYANVMLSGRTLSADGTWNTLCLPFDVDDFSGTALEGFIAMELDTETARDGHMTGIDPMDMTYYLNFKPATGIKAGQPYLVKRKSDLDIASEADWNTFAANVASGMTYEGQTVQLTADIAVSTMVGTSDNRFKGTFDGNGHTLTISNLPATGQYCAPFRYVDGATFRNLHTAGNLAASAKYRSGLVGEIRNNVTISNCWSSVAINSSVNGDGTHGGFIGEVKSGGNVVIDNCLFDGSFTGPNTNSWGGFVGWSQGATTIKNSAFLPQDLSVDSSSSATFGRNNVTTVNCYYSVALGTAQGNDASGKSAEQLAEALGRGWQVNDGKVVPLMTSNITIGSEADWNTFAANVTNGMTYEGQMVSLVADIAVNTMAGTSDHRFKGTFDGNGHTLTVNLTASGQYFAPFRHVDGANFNNLHTAGTIAGSYKYCAGLIGESNGDVAISNCWSSVTINSSVNGDGTHGGFIGEVKSGGNVVIDNSLFDGSFTGSNTNCWGGFVGWSQGVTTISNSAFLPKELPDDRYDSATFGRNNNKVTTENCYYTVALGTAQGNDAGNMTAAEIANALGSGWLVNDGNAVPLMASAIITAPMFYGVTIKNVNPVTVASTDGTVSFKGSYSPVKFGANDHTKLFLGDANTLHHPNNSITLGSCRAGFQMQTSGLGDVNGDGGLSVADVVALVNHVMGNDNDNINIGNADMNGDGTVTITDVAVLVGMILNESQNLNIVVNTGDTPITYKGGGNGAARVSKNTLGDEE